MNILAINFDLNWFLTIPGMLITGGILLLLIALIVFIATSGSGKKDKLQDKNNVATNNPISNDSVNELNSTMNQGVPPITPVDSANINSINQEMPQATVTPVMEPVQEVTPIVQEAPVVSAPTVEIATNETPAEVNANFIPPVVDTPVTSETIQPQVQEVSPAPMPAPEVSIYGGVSPIANVQPKEEPQRQIYGGANPLDATQAIPIVEPVQHVEYGVPVEPKIEEQPMFNEPKEPVPNESEPLTDIINIQPVEVPKMDEVNNESLPVENANTAKNDNVDDNINSAPIENIVEQPSKEQSDEIEVLEL